MSTETIRGKLHTYLEVADDNKIRAIYNFMEDEINKSVLIYSNELKEELKRRKEAFMTGQEKVITAAESRERIQQILKAKEHGR